MHGFQLSIILFGVISDWHSEAAALKEGKLQDAEKLYRAILQSQPNHPDAFMENLQHLEVYFSSGFN